MNMKFKNKLYTKSFYFWKSIPLGFVFVITLINGCINYEQEVSLYPDGSGTIDIHYWMKIPNYEKNQIVNDIGIFNPDSIKKEFTSTENIETEVKNIKVYSDTTDSTIHSVIRLWFKHIDSLNNMRQFNGFNFSLKDGAEKQKIFSQFIPPIAIGFGFDVSDYYVTYIYDFPGEIITHNATDVTNKKLIWKYRLDEIGKGKTISVTYRPFKLKETPKWIYALSGLVLLIVIIFLFRKKRD